MAGILAKKLNRFYNPIFYFKKLGILDHVRSLHLRLNYEIFCREKQRIFNQGTIKKRRTTYVFISGSTA
jgi:hypothetical protein